jgi:ADP-ribose pyrophosphatase
VTEPRTSREVHASPFLTVAVETWEDLGDYEVVRRPDAAAVLAVTPEGDALLVRQFRPAVRQVLTEVPAGLLDVEGEDALTCAARELFEETGFRHTAIEFVGGFYTSAGFTDEYVHLFRAATAAESEGTPEAGIELIRRPLGEMVAAARAGKVRDAKSALALILAGDLPPLVPGEASGVG